VSVSFDLDSQLSLEFRKARAFDWLDQGFPFPTCEDVADIMNAHRFRGKIYGSALEAAEVAMEAERTRLDSETERS
jgi:hypothetical protein